MTGEQTNIKVAVRVRPYNRQELEQNQQCIIKVIDEKTMLFDPENEDDEFFFQGTKQHYRDITKRMHKKMTMEFDRVFDTNATNHQIFEECTEPLVDAVLNGYNCSVFVYGATGAGKTFTMLGSALYPGLTFLTMKDLFSKVEGQSDKTKFDVGVSYLEVYNEQVKNLLTKSDPLKLREDSNGVIVSGLVLKPIHSAQELLGMLALGNSHRTQHPTDANAESSRSHAIFQVHIRMTDRTTGTKRTVKLSMIDLAGSERAASTRGIGLRFKEGASINKSLLALGNCINKLADGQKHIPYRDSNLTRILKDSLGGNCRTLMVANVSMSSLTYDDTYNTLKYASRAKTIRTTLRQNAMKTNMPKEFYVKKVVELMAESERVKLANKALEAKLQTTTSNARTYDENDLKTWYSKIDAVFSAVVKVQEYVLGIQSKIKSLNLQNELKFKLESLRRMLSPSDEQEPPNTECTNHQLETQKAELQRWRKKLLEANKDLDKLKREISECKYANILRIYQKSKELEVDNSKQAINVNHVTTINSYLLSDSHLLRQALALACELLKGGEHDQVDKLMRLMGTSNNKDSDEEVAAAPDGELRNGKRAFAGTSNETLYNLPHSASKRACHKAEAAQYTDTSLSTSDEELSISAADSVLSGVFKMPPQLQLNGKPAANMNLNETRVLPKSLDLNNTFDLDMKGIMAAEKAPLSTGKTTFRSNLVNGMLSEQVVRVAANKDHLRNALMKSKNFNHAGLLKSITASVQKENKKYSPGKIRKSPRSGAAKVLASTTNFVRKQVGRPLVGAQSSGEPLVRTNRAASFRVKK